jgi:LacI family transcriptional regulator/LacI family repressor for deo operon, udp, cdd, tsx, nupC, and nupG
MKTLLFYGGLRLLFGFSIKGMVSLKDVGEHVGVSASTVSRVINRPEKVKKETRWRVEEAIRTLGYNPNRVARRLRSSEGRARILGLIIPDIQNSFYSEVVRGVEDVAYDEDYAVILCSSDEDSEREQFYLDVLRGESADGVILAPHDGTARLGEEVSLPVVCFDRRLPEADVDTVVVDNRRGARALTEHLLELGHRRIGIICSSLDLSTTTERLAGYRDAIGAAGVDVEEALVRSGGPRRETGYREAQHLLDMEAPPTAIFAVNNQLVLGALEAVRQCGLQVPDDLTVAGFDDAPWSSLLAAPLTTVRQPTYEMGRRAAELLFQRIDDPKRDEVLVTLQPSLVVRASSGAPARGESAQGEPLAAASE